MQSLYSTVTADWAKTERESAKYKEGKDLLIKPGWFLRKAWLSDLELLEIYQQVNVNNIFKKRPLNEFHCFFGFCFRIIIILPLDFFTPALAGGLSAESDWQEVSLGFEDSSQLVLTMLWSDSLDSFSD